MWDFKAFLNTERGLNVLLRQQNVGCSNGPKALIRKTEDIGVCTCVCDNEGEYMCEQNF